MRLLESREPTSDRSAQQVREHRPTYWQADQGSPVPPHDTVQEITQQVDAQQHDGEPAAPGSPLPEPDRRSGAGCRHNDHQ
jgi:hypothetical protein